MLVPKSTLGNWEREFSRWFPSARVLKFYAAGKAERELLRLQCLVHGEFDVLLTSYEVTKTYQNTLACLQARPLR